ncbi:MAG TPA: GtrA family protein, partial [Terriglobales bacterium]|nr:GtrA family protein [Terriglobales bacterium]
MSWRQPGLVRWAKFNAVGAMGIVVQLGVLALLRSGLGINYLFATVFGVEAAVVHNFLWHERFTWADRRLGSAPRRFWRFNFTTGLFSLAGNVLFTKLFVDAGVPYL